jgi:hypothetical protein
VYGAVPPVAVTVAVPVPPAHAILVLLVLATKAMGCVMVTVWVVLVPKESVAVTE